MKPFRIIILLLLPVLMQAQQSRQAIEALIDKCAATIDSKPDSAYSYIYRATIESKKIQDDFLTSRCLYNLGYIYFLQQKPESATKYFRQAIPYAEKSANYKILALAYNQLGLIYMDQSDYNQSLKSLLHSLEIAEKNKLPKNKCNALNNLALLYEIQKDTVKALDYYKQNESIARQNDFKEMLMANYINMAILKRKSDKKFAVNYLRKAHELAKMLDDIQAQFNILINLSDAYLSQNDYRNTYKSLLMARVKAMETRDNSNLFFVYFNLGGYYDKLGNHSDAISMYEKALSIPKTGISHDQYVNLLGAVANAYKNSGDYQKAYRYQEQYHLGKDSLFSVAKNEAFNDIQTKYEVSKKNLRINLLTKEKQIERNRKILIICISIVLLLPLITLLFFYKHRIHTQKIISQKEQELKRIKGVIQGQDEERNRIAKEIHDGIGGKLAGIKLSLSVVNQVVKNDTITQIIGQLTGLFQELRSISHNLSHHYIKDKSLETLLEELQDGYHQRKEFGLEITVFPENTLEELSDDTKHHIYRILQELLSNVSRHARATQVVIGFTRYQDKLNIIMEDNGSGFEKGTPPGIGLKNIQERLATLSGSIHIDSSPESGTAIIIDIPPLNNTA